MFLLTWEIPIIVIVGLILIFVIWYISVMNRLRQLEVKVEEAMSGIDVALTKRFDVLTKMLDTTKGYAKHEAETLEKVIKWRNGIPADATLEEKQEFANSLTRALSGLNVVVERYPELKADRAFSNLQNAIMDTEEHLQAARRLFNENVRSLNHMIVTFPQSWVARRIGMEKKDFFEAEEYKREDVKMDF
ncbi:MAG TPA: LemA family protein [Acholeplasmataceae bacterium]|nr:LemA family protein [Acholeplasmataceae bacterium]